MNMPGFTAEASLLNSDMRYQATAKATVYGGFVQPAIFDVSTPAQSGIYDNLFAMKFPHACYFLGYVCQFRDPVSDRCLIGEWRWSCP